MEDQELLVSIENGIGWIKLNRPKVLNALSHGMIEGLYDTLTEWMKREDVALICLEGNQDKAFCAGGDVRQLYDLKDNGVKDYAMKFFEKEYALNMLIHTYTKPILAYMNGFVMGGGVGICIGASHRLVTETTKWAMPEMNIGLYPDVGGSYFLPKMPGFVGTYLALTSKTIKADDVLYAGGADYFIQSSKWPSIKEALMNSQWTLEGARQGLTDLLKNVSEVRTQPSELAELQTKIDHHFNYDTMEGIIASLEEGKNQGDPWSEAVLSTLLEKSPTSLKVTLMQMIKGKNTPMLDCFKMEFGMSMTFMKEHDFFEGVRAVLVDKDRSPKWNPDKIEKVSNEAVEPYFNNEWKDLENLFLE